MATTIVHETDNINIGWELIEINGDSYCFEKPGVGGLVLQIPNAKGLKIGARYIIAFDK